MLIRIFIILFIITGIFAQPESIEEVKKYYPLHIGDYWEYETISNEPGLADSSWKFYKLVIGDTLVNTKKYFIIEQAELNSADKQFSYYRVDSVNANVYRLLGSREELVDSLFAQLNDTLLYCYYVKSFEEKEIFNERRSSRFVDQFCTSNTAYDGYELTKGLGLTYSYYNEVFLYSFYEYTYLHYAKIKGVEYGIKTNIEEKNTLTNKFELSQNYPNPFNPTTKIKFSIPSDVKREMSDVKLIVYDILGREIKTLFNKSMQPGEYEVEFDATGLPSGVYFYRLNSGSFSQTRKMVLLR
ncbi:MAG: T9SS type A sorting domain-containing protein [Melioribacteraceae bacterium]|nr:MAG: T9SS type A sorting domain-containing protein [Melioribacteraceae bacterium]